MNGTLTPKLGDYRFHGSGETDTYILVDGNPQWRAARWENANQFRSDAQDYRWVVKPVLADNEVLMETVEGPVEILTKPFSRLT